VTSVKSDHERERSVRTETCRIVGSGPHSGGMRRGDWYQHPLLTAPDGPVVVRAKDLLDVGVPRRTITRRCEPGGPWRSLLPGIILLQNGEPTGEHRIRAALAHGGEGAMLTGIRALQRYGLERVPAPEDVHVLVPADRRITAAGFVRVERTARLPRPFTRQDVPVAPVHRAVLDAARRLSDYDAVLAMMAEAVQRRRCTVQALADELELGSQRGVALPRRALVPLQGGARSVAEADAWSLWKRSGLPEFVWNVKVFDNGGRYIATPDGWCDRVALAWEIDSRGCHAAHDDYAATVARNTRYVTAGIVVLSTLPIRLRTEPDLVVAELRAAYEIARQRPRPEVHLR